MRDKRYIQLYYGDGKGKTTAAVGLALRALGHGQRVLLLQFLKQEPSGEIVLLEKEGARILRGMGTSKFVFQMNAEEKAAAKNDQNELLAKAQKALEKEKYDLFILDEAADVWELEMADHDLLQKIVAANRENVEIVLTGHTPPAWMFACADYITEMKCHKHPYEQGVQARKGIEY